MGRIRGCNMIVVCAKIKAISEVLRESGGNVGNGDALPCIARLLRSSMHTVRESKMLSSNTAGLTSQNLTSSLASGITISGSRDHVWIHLLSLATTSSRHAELVCRRLE